MPKPKVRLQRVGDLARCLLNVAAGGAAIATTLGFAGNLWWVFELLDHPRPQYCLILLVALVVGGISRRAWCFVWCVPLLLNLALIVPLFFPSTQGFYLGKASPTPSTTLRVLHANLNHDNQNTAQAIQYIESQNVDLVLLQEVTSRWLTTLQSALLRYQVVKSFPLENSHGLAMLLPVKPSKSIELVAAQIIDLPAYSDQPLLDTTLHLGNKELEILSLSIIRPRNFGTSTFQNVEFDAAAKWSIRQQQEYRREVVVIGDFNTTPWSRRFRKFLHDSALRNSQRGFGLQPTWKADLPSVLMIAIDHCLHSKSITTVNRATGSNIGSDHLPIFVELRL